MKDRSLSAPVPFFLRDSEAFELSETVPADVFSFEDYDISRVVAKDAGGLILSQNDVFSLNEDLYGIFFLEIEGGPEFLGNDYPAELVELSDDSGRFHDILSISKY